MDDKYRDLRWIVEARGELGGWEPIAAFNAKEVAESYAQSGKSRMNGYKYRVIARVDQLGWVAA